MPNEKFNEVRPSVAFHTIWPLDGSGDLGKFAIQGVWSESTVLNSSGTCCFKTYPSNQTPIDCIANLPDLAAKYKDTLLIAIPHSYNSISHRKKKV